MLKHIALTTGFVALSISPALAQVRIVDQSNVASTSSNGQAPVGHLVVDAYSANGRVGQTFSPTLTALNFFTFDIDNFTNSEVRNVDGSFSTRPGVDTNLAVYLYSGTGTPNAADLLGISQSVFLAANTRLATVQFDFATPIALVPQQMYTARVFDLTNLANPSILPGATVYECGSAYTRGKSTYSDGTNADLCFSEGLSTPNVAAAVPEPATWAMMTLGFGAMGLAMRRKKVSTGIRFA